MKTDWREKVSLVSGPAIRARFKSGEYLTVSFSANDQLLIVSSSGRVDWHVCANGSVGLQPTPRQTAAPKPPPEKQ